MRLNPDSLLSEHDVHDVVALADGSLAPDRQAEVRARVAASPLLSEALERQRRAIKAIRAAAIPAPSSLRAHVDAEREPRGVLRARLALGFGGVAAAAALGIVVALPADSPGDPSLTEVAALGTQAVRDGPPAEHPAHPTWLKRGEAGLPFPNPREPLGWRPVGTRVDRVAGRRATTVFYARNGRRVAYTIVAGEALDPPRDRQRTIRDGIAFATFASNGRQAVTWLRRGHTCVLSGRGTSRTQLIELAQWTGKGTLPS
jgi:hypothetical protein